jgi:RNA polymerase sigma-70 factor, ECF subfamily
VTPPPLSCRELVELVTDYLEGRLPEAERRRFEEHLGGCDGCTAYVEQFRRTITTVGALSEDDVPGDAAEDVVQETWLAVLEGVDRFEARASLKTWMFRILVKRAITRAGKDRRQVPFSALADPGDDEGPTVAAERFLGPDAPRWAGHWASEPSDWACVPDDRLLSRETLEQVCAAIDRLPERQRDVIVLRDIGGFDAEEVCSALDLSEGNQRVLLHRARAKVRQELEDYLDDT